MKKAFLTGIALFAIALPAYAEDAATTTTTTTTTTADPSAAVAPAPATGSTTAVVPPGTAPTVVVEESKPRDAITGKPVEEVAPAEKEKSIRDKVRDKMDH